MLIVHDQIKDNSRSNNSLPLPNHPTTSSSPLPIQDILPRPTWCLQTSTCSWTWDSIQSEQRWQSRRQADVCASILPLNTKLTDPRSTRCPPVARRQSRQEFGGDQWPCTYPRLQRNRSLDRGSRPQRRRSRQIDGVQRVWEEVSKHGAGAVSCGEDVGYPAI